MLHKNLSRELNNFKPHVNLQKSFRVELISDEIYNIISSHDKKSGIHMHIKNFESEKGKKN